MARARKTTRNGNGTKSPAHESFRAWRRGFEGNNEWVADLLGVNASQVSRWANGLARPDLPQIAILEQVAKIPWRDWLTKKEQREVAATVLSALEKVGQ